MTFCSPSIVSRLLAVLLCCAAAPASFSDPGWAANEASARGRITPEDTVHAALFAHKGLQAAREGREALVHERSIAGAGYGPSVNVNAGGGYGFLNDAAARRRDEEGRFAFNGNAGISVVQPVYDGFATRSRTRAAQASLDSASHRVFAAATDLALEAVIAHIGVLQRRETVRLAEENEMRHKGILAQVRDRARMGVDAAADVAQTETRLSRARASLAEARASLRACETTYRRLTGNEPGALAPVQTPARFYTGPKEVIGDAMEHNPVLSAYIRDIMVARAGKELADASFHPIIDARLDIRHSDRESVDNQRLQNADASLILRWNVYSHNADTAASRAAAAKVRQTRQTMYDYVDDMALRAHAAWIDYLSSQKLHEHYSDAVRFNKGTRVAYQEQFISGQRSLLDLLSADNELFSSSTQAVAAYGSFLENAYRLLGLSGTLLPGMNVDVPRLTTPPDPPLPAPRETR